MTVLYSRIAFLVSLLKTGTEIAIKNCGCCGTTGPTALKELSLFHRGDIPQGLSTLHRETGKIHSLLFPWTVCCAYLGPHSHKYGALSSYFSFFFLLLPKTHKLRKCQMRSCMSTPRLTFFG